MNINGITIINSVNGKLLLTGNNSINGKYFHER